MEHEEIVNRVQSELKSTQTFCLSGRRISSSLRETRKDAQLIVESLIVWSGMLLDFADFSPTFSSENAAQRGRLIKLIEPAVLSITIFPLEDSLHFLDDVTSIVINEITKHPGIFKGYQSLNKAIGEICESSICPAPLKDLIRLCVRSFKRLDRYDKGDHVTTFRYFLSITRFLKKIPIDRNDLLDFMVADYLTDECRLEGVDARLQDESSNWWVYSLNTLAREVFSDFSFDAFCPKHGPGRVAEDDVKSMFDKYLNMSDDARISYLLRKHGFGTLSDYAPMNLTRPSSRTAKFICVPKTWKTLRGISAEPVELQYSQQAVLFQLDNYFSQNSFFRKRLDLHSQLENQRLARIGSLDQSLATIDLSKASDSVSLQLVKQIFKGTKLLPWLLATRSTSVELPNYGVIKTKKFAPMGSSTCFPVECIIFILIAEVARRTITSQSRGGIIPTPRVFGDDIVCASTTVPLVLDGLDQLGFLPNKEKSFWTGFYRESCGKEYWYGQDISPIYYRVEGGNLASRITTYDGITSITSLYNALYLNGYNTARRIVLSFLIKKEIMINGRKFRYSDLCIRTFDGNHGSIISSMPTNFQIRKSVHKGYQSLGYRKVSWKRSYVALSKLLLTSDYAQEVLYFLWHTEACRRDEDRDLPIQDGKDEYSRLPIGYEMVPLLKRGSSFYGLDIIE